MKALFLSASVPVQGRGHYFDTADPFLIQTAVRELVIATIRDYTLVWGGHPAITPMIWAICEDVGVEYSNRVVLYQSEFFEQWYPEENRRFGNIELVEKVEDDREASLLRMRTEMLSRPDLFAAVFIGGMEGIAAEYALFRKFHPDLPVLPVSSPGGAARELAIQLGVDSKFGGLDFARLFRSHFPPAPQDASVATEVPPSSGEERRGALGQSDHIG